MRKIIHIDMDCFFAAVEMRDDPSLRDIPIAIASTKVQRGVISTCNYPARAFGVRSAMPTAKALQLCPHLRLVPGHMDKYKAVSTHLQAIFHRYTDKVEPLSLDEAYLDVSNSTLYQGSATRIAEAIRHDIVTELALTASAGVAPCKFLAKIASDENKPNGLFVITPAMVDGFVQRLPLHKIPGVGQKTAARLAQLGLFYCQDIHQFPLHTLVKEFGRFAEVLLERSKGIDPRPVETQRERKSIGVEHTFNEDLTHWVEAEPHLQQLLLQLQRRIERSGAQQHIQKIGVKLKFDDFQQTTIERQTSSPNRQLLMQLLQQAWIRGGGKNVRLLGLQVGLKSLEPQAQLGLHWS